MKHQKVGKRAAVITAVLAALVSIGTVSAAAAFEDYSDIDHWAQESLRRGYEDGIITGFEDMTMRPDEPITDAQIMTLLCRTLGAEKTGDVSGVYLPEDAWYAESAAKAAYLGMLEGIGGIYDSPMTRAQALRFLCSAFYLVGAETDLSVLDRFSDAGELPEETKPAVARLVAMGLVEGYDGSINGGEYITRAEFFELLYRVRDNVYILPCGEKNLPVNSKTQDTMVLRCHEPGSVYLQNSSVKRLVLAPGEGTLRLGLYGTSSVESIIVAGGGGSVYISGNAGRVEILSSGREIVLQGSVEEIEIFGSGNTVTIDGVSSAGNVRLLGEDNRLKLYGSITKNLEITGHGSAVEGYGYVRAVTLNTVKCQVKPYCHNITDNADHGIESAGITVTAEESITPTDKLTAFAVIDGVEEGLVCRGEWYVNDTLISQSDVNTAEGPAKLSVRLRYDESMGSSVTLRFDLKYVTLDGVEQTVSGTAETALEGFEDIYNSQEYARQVLETVTDAYAGDYTTEWAVANDYSDPDKEIWVNAKGYASQSEYLIWINLTYQRMNVFRGSQGDWELEHSFLVGSGADSTPTPRGEWLLTYKKPEGWIFNTYKVKTVVGFKGGGYAFHSRLHSLDGSYLVDPSIGFPVSHGCIRMYDEDVLWVHDNVPVGTTVVVH